VKANVIEDGSITIPARKLLSICKEMEESIAFDCDGSLLKVTSGKSLFKLKGLPADDFPKVEIPELPFVKIGIREAIAKTAFAMANDDRTNLNGVFVETTSLGNNMVATDGHRLALCKFNAPVFLEKGIIIPRKALAHISKMGKEVEMAVEGDNLYVKDEGASLKVRLVDGSFPDYKRVIPNDSSLNIEMVTVPFMATLNRIALITSEKFSGTTITLGKGKMTLFCSSDEGDSTEEIDVSYTGEDVVLSFNVNYLKDAVGVVDKEKFIFQINAGLRPSIVKENGYLCVVMPLKG